MSRSCYCCNKALDNECNMCGRRLCSDCTYYCNLCSSPTCDDHMVDKGRNCKNCEYQKSLILENH